MLDLALVGTGGMQPLPNRWLASALVRFERHLLLFDCGEGTQISLRQLGWGLKNIDVILISHLHGDHVGGLPGLLLTQGNAGRTEPLDVYGPLGLTRVVTGLRVIAPYLPFEVRCHELEGAGPAFTLGSLQASYAPTDHGVPGVAFRLSLPRARRFLPERAAALGLPRETWSVLQHGQPVPHSGRTVQTEEVLGPPRRGLALGLIPDSRPTEHLVDLVRGVDLLLCEGNFGSADEQQRAVERKHMTFAEAAALARAADVGQLVLTHFSAGLTDPDACLDEARAIFPASAVGHDHDTFSLRFDDAA